jgi:hypothetical protein
MNAAPVVLLVVAFIAANLPFVSPRVLIVGPRKRGHALGWELIGLLLMAALVIGGGMAWEARIGQRAPQEWEFYAAFAGLFITLAFPGFVWRHLRRRRPAG